jgi:hypothetical protein
MLESHTIDQVVHAGVIVIGVNYWQSALILSFFTVFIAIYLCECSFFFKSLSRINQLTTFLLSANLYNSNMPVLFVDV